MKRIHVDVAIIGAGTAGLSAWRAATANGATALLIEGGPHGTTCARVGCMPSKLLIAAAEAAHAIAAAPAFGVHVDGPVRIDGREVMARVKAERDRFVGFVLRDVERMPAADRLAGHARVIDERTLDVGGHTEVTAACIVIATGSQATRPPMLAALGDRVVINDNVFDWDDLPRSVAVAGPGIVGLELGQALHRLGVRVAVYGRSGSLGPLRDPEVLARAIEVFRKEVALESVARIDDLAREGDEVVVRRRDADGGEITERFDYVLAATGRVPNVAGLGLEATPLALDADGVPLFDPATGRARRTKPEGAGGEDPESTIFVAGDAGNFRPVLHEAADEGRIAGTNAARLALGRGVVPGLRRAAMEVMFTDPQIAIVGGGFAALAPGRSVTGRVDFRNQGRARVMARNEGLLHVYADIDSRQLVGAEMVGPAAEHLAHLLAWALQSRLTIDRMLAMPFYHPVVEEGLRTALYDARAKLQQRAEAAAGTPTEPNARTPNG